MVTVRVTVRVPILLVKAKLSALRLAVGRLVTVALETVTARVIVGFPRAPNLVPLITEDLWLVTFMFRLAGLAPRR